MSYQLTKDLTPDLAAMLDLISQKYQSDLAVHDYNKSRLLVNVFKSRAVSRDKIEEKFKEAFPEFSTEVITWFRKNKHLL